MITLPSLDQIQHAREPNIWSHGNKLLYDLCEANFSHTEDDVIITKVLFIGRIYAAAIERRRSKDEIINDNFYTDRVLPAFKDPEIDQNLQRLKKIGGLSLEHIPQILFAHQGLISILKKITSLNKRSFSSKYLHFHLPHLFFIYDSRSVSALRTFIIDIPSDLKSFTVLKDIDIEYAKFFCGCFELQRNIQQQCKISLTPRQLDNILIAQSNKMNITLPRLSKYPITFTPDQNGK